MAALPGSSAVGRTQEVSGSQAIVLGASSQIGIFSIPRLVARGVKVWAVSREPRPEWYPDIDGVTWIGLQEAMDGACAAAGFVLSTGPLELAVSCLGDRRAPIRLAAISTTSVISKAASVDEPERREVEAIAGLERKLTRLCDGRGWAWSMLRPTLIYGAGLDHNVSLLARFIQRFGFLPVSRDAHGLRQPVHADDVAGAAVEALFTSAAAGLVTPLCGGSTLDYSVMVERIFEGLGKPPRIVRVPAGMLVAAAGVAGVLGQQRMVRPAMIRRQAIDLVFDDSPARSALGYQPRSFRPGRPDFKLPGPDVLRELAAHPSHD